MWHSVTCVNLKKESLKILEIHFSYNKKLEQEKNFGCHIVKIENVLKSWKMRDLPIEGKIIIFKTLAISKIVCLGLVTSEPAIIIKQLNKKTLFGKGRKQNKTLYCAKYLRIRWS